MAVYQKLSRSKVGAIHRRNIVVEDLTGPAADVTIAAAGTGTLTFNIASEVPRDIAWAGVESVSGLPATVKIDGIVVDKTAKTLTLNLVNTDGTNAATITANSVTVRVVSVA